jgi:hypothetical protein
MLAFFTTAAVFLLSVTVNLELATAQDSGGLSDQQACLLSCSLAAFTASGCDMCVQTFCRRPQTLIIFSR